VPSVQVDLSVPTLQNKIKMRFDLLANTADELYLGQRRLLNPQEVHCNHSNIARCVEAYFLLSEAYKVVRLGHEPRDAKHTMNPKKAALTALCAFAFRPFRLADPTRPPMSTVSSVANLHFVLDFASTVLLREFSNLSRDMHLRLFRFLRVIRIAALDEYISDQRANAVKHVYTPDIDRDLPVIEMLVLFFELHGTGDQNAHDD
jgi:hypothetical protein